MNFRVSGENKKVGEKSAHLHYLEILDVFTFCIQYFLDDMVTL
jgi:hypothetical protein